MEAISREKEEMVRCPFEYTHYIPKSRLTTHLAKCQKNFPNSKLVRCNYNATHLIPQSELQRHNATCSDRYKFEMLFDEGEITTNLYPIQKINVSTEELWDNDNVPTYDPREYCEANNVITRLSLATPSEKKRHRMAQRQKINKLEYTKHSAQSQASTSKCRRFKETQPIVGPADVNGASTSTKKTAWEQQLVSSSSGKENQPSTTASTPSTPTKDDQLLTSTSTPNLENANTGISEEKRTSPEYTLVIRKRRRRKFNNVPELKQG